MGVLYYMPPTGFPHQHTTASSYFFKKNLHNWRWCTSGDHVISSRKYCHRRPCIEGNYSTLMPAERILPQSPGTFFPYLLSARRGGG